MDSNVNSDELMQAVMKNREKILVLERIVEELVNTGYVDQSDYRRFHKEVVEQVKMISFFTIQRLMNFF